MKNTDAIEEKCPKRNRQIWARKHNPYLKLDKNANFVVFLWTCGTRANFSVPLADFQIAWGEGKVEDLFLSIVASWPSEAKEDVSRLVENYSITPSAIRRMMARKSSTKFPLSPLSGNWGGARKEDPIPEWLWERCIERALSTGDENAYRYIEAYAGKDSDRLYRRFHKELLKRSGEQGII